MSTTRDFAGRWKMRMIGAIDHVVLTTRDEVKCIEFYTGVLGMALERYGNDRIALCFGKQKINVHQPGVMAGLKADAPTPGSLDLCFIASVPLDRVIERLSERGVPIIAGPVIRAGAASAIRSVYVRDPDADRRGPRLACRRLRGNHRCSRVRASSRATASNPSTGRR
jgi:catechol 2,3-dioxygenase-like lactoylglutathione lyase family enzyme